ncbi:MAG: primosomal protein N' [Candidatus Schekmanbacteria bacterium]|nr:primosomal protein N' [Candidatus Schekmanbacteria bacterium]
MEKQILVQVAFNFPGEQDFSYILPPELAGIAQIGQRVSVPFANRRLIGYLSAIHTPKPENDIQLKSVMEILDPEPLLDAHSLQLAKWIGEYYCCPWGMVLESFLPPGLKGKTILRPKQQKYYQLALTRIEAESRCLELRAPRQVQLIRLLLERDTPVSAEELRDQGEFSPSALQGLLEKKIIEVFEREKLPQVYYGRDAASKTRPSPTASQQKALERIREGLEQNKFVCLLLHGVTGSGKTEVYLQAVEQVLQRGKQALILVPEIALTPQLVERFRSRFGERIGLLHSQMNKRERLWEWQRLRQGIAAVGIGVRSAILAPLPYLGLIVVDEEHETSFKQDKMPRYHARDVAVMRAKMLNIPVIIGSATPSLESYYNTQNGKAGLIHMPERIQGSSLPEVIALDLRGQKGVEPPLFAPQLKDALNDRLQKGEQSLLFLNRRGHYSFALCKECGQCVKCPQCSVSLTYHSHGHVQRCHYCDYIAEPLTECPQCKGALLSYAGLGTQRLEKEVQALFPQARVMRMDRDSTRGKNAHWDFFAALKNKEVDIILGTQMIAKGLDFPGITLVGVIAADLILNFPDFRAAEHTFQLLTQVVGRAGRGESAGLAIIQTFLPDHYSIQAACRHDYQGFYQSEMHYRRDLGYPPFYRLTNLLLRSKDQDLPGRTARQLVNYLSRAKIEGLRVLGANQAPLSMLRGEYRWQVLIKAPSTAVIRQGVNKALEFWRKEQLPSRLRLDIDVDAISLL